MRGGKEHRKGDRRPVGKEREKGNISSQEVSPFLEIHARELKLINSNKFDVI